MEPFIGQIMAVGFNFAPRGWSTCSGQILPISSHTALFSLLGTTFGGDGRTTFGLPDLRGRSIVGQGNGPGLSPVNWGQKGGSQSFSITVPNMPSHNHIVNAVAAPGDELVPNNALPAGDSSRSDKIYNAAGVPNTTMKSNMISNTGGSQPINKQSPYLGMYYNIALVGIFPSRN